MDIGQIKHQHLTRYISDCWRPRSEGVKHICEWVCWLIWPLRPALEFALAEKLDTTHFTLSACEFRNWIRQQTHTDGQIEAQNSQTRETAHRSWLDHTHGTWWTATGWTVTDCSHDLNTNGWQTCSINDVNKALLGMEFHHAPYEDTSRAKCGFKQHDVSLYFLRQLFPPELHLRLSLSTCKSVSTLHHHIWLPVLRFLMLSHCAADCYLSLENHWNDCWKVSRPQPLFYFVLHCEHNPVTVTEPRGECYCSQAAQKT